MAALGGVAAALPLPLREALAIPPSGKTGTIRDVEHVVILMQENRSFDHYFGTLKGVRGFSDPHPLTLAGGSPVWHQPSPLHRDGYIAPFHLDTQTTAAQCMSSLDHSWKGSQSRWKNYDAWLAAKGPMTMGYFTRDDLPFYYALADAFTICDAYHCSIFGPTNPNRLFLFSGTNGLSIGNDGLQAIENPAEETNNCADPAFDDPRFKPLTWMTYAERLQGAGIDWRVYQEFDNYGDNGLAYFANFRGKNAGSELGQRARSWPASSNKENAASSRGEHLIAQFAADVAADRLPQVSWIVAPYIMCEHPAAPPGYGEAFVSQLLSALASNPKVWAKTAFILNYDENDGFFDHMPPPVPPLAPEHGKSTVDISAEVYKDEPVGLGPRVPLIVVSPWTRGGFVNSQLSDHTSVLRFLEVRFGVMEPQISPWRRAVCGDLTSIFDFSGHDSSGVTLPPTAGKLAAVDATCRLHPPQLPKAQSAARQETGQKPSRPLPYDLGLNHRSGDDAFQFGANNSGGVGVAFTVYDRARDAGPWYYTVEAGKALSDILNVSDAAYSFEIHGPNGFFRDFRGIGGSQRIEISEDRDPASEEFILRITNHGDKPITFEAKTATEEPPRSLTVLAGRTVDSRYAIAANAHWYDISLTSPDAPGFLRRFAGHVETGKASLTDPALG